jgi:hypothetical protein
LNPACAQSQIRPTLGAQGRGQRRATLRRNGKRAPPVVAHRHTIQPSHAEPSSHFAEAQIHARLTNPAKPNIITSIRGSRRPVADFKSEPRPASNRNQWPASYWNAWPASSVSAPLRINWPRRHRARARREGRRNHPLCFCPLSVTRLFPMPATCGLEGGCPPDAGFFRGKLPRE